MHLSAYAWAQSTSVARFVAHDDLHRCSVQFSRLVPLLLGHLVRDPRLILIGVAGQDRFEFLLPSSNVASRLSGDSELLFVARESARCFKIQSLGKWEQSRAPLRRGLSFINGIKNPRNGLIILVAPPRWLVERDVKEVVKGSWPIAR